MANFTPQEIEQFLQEFFDTVGARQYIGARYVPIFGRAGELTIEWDDNEPYEPLTVVMHEGVSYVSRRYIPAGIPVTNTEYWAETYRFNAQVEQYRQEVLRVRRDMDDLSDEVRSDYVPFPAGDLPKYGNTGQVLATLADGTTVWNDPVEVTSEVAGPLIDEWLDEHPEATTTVLDNSIGTAKLVNAAVTGPKLAQSSVGTANIVNNSVTNGKLDSTGALAYSSAGRVLEVGGLTYSNGFITTAGTVSERDDYRYSNEYIEVWKGDRLRFTCGTSSPSALWLKLALYDYTHTFLTRVDVDVVAGEAGYSFTADWIVDYTIETAPYYIRPTFSVATSADDWIFTISKLPSTRRLEQEISAHEAVSVMGNRFQEVVDVPRNYRFVETADNGNVISTNGTNNASYASKLVSCVPGDRFMISGTGGTSLAARLWVFLDVNNRIITGESANVTVPLRMIEAPSGASKLLVNFNLNHPYSLIRGYDGDAILPGTVLNSSKSHDYYIPTGDNVATIDLTPVYFRGYAWSYFPCTAGDRFTLYARGGNAGRAWAFVSVNGTILSRSEIGHACNGEVIEAPTYAGGLVVNSEDNQLRCYKNGIAALSASVREAAIPSVHLCDMPKDQVAMPTVEYLAPIEENVGTAVAKTAIFKNGDWFCITYGQNVIGTATDVPLIGGAGCLEMVYKRFRYDNGTETDVQYGRIAKIGDTYTDYEGNQAVMVGGCGLPSGIDNLQYFTTPYTVTGGDRSYEFAGIQNYGFTPCCCAVNIGSDGTVSIGEIKELVLVVGGVSGKFDLHRVDPLYQNAYTYVTTAPPAKHGTTWYWAQVVRNGVAILTSPDGITWTYQRTIHTPYQPKCEVVISAHDNQLMLGIRTNPSSSIDTNNLYLMMVAISNFVPTCEYKIPFVESRTQIVPTGDEWLLFNPTNDKTIVECIRICRIGNILRFWRWFSVYVKPTWYVTCYQPSVSTVGFTDMYLAGGNAPAGSDSGLSFMHLSFDGSLPHSPLSIPASVG